MIAILSNLVAWGAMKLALPPLVASIAKGLIMQLGQRLSPELIKTFEDDVKSIAKKAIFAYLDAKTIVLTGPDVMQDVEVWTPEFKALAESVGILRSKTDERGNVYYDLDQEQRTDPEG